MAAGRKQEPPMTGSRSICRTAILTALLAGPMVAQAADLPTFEITPFAGYRFGGGFDIENDAGDESSVDLESGASWGVGLGLYAHDLGTYDFVYSTQESSFDSNDPTLRGIDVTVQYFHLGGTAFFPQDRKYLPYLSLGLGATRLEPDQGGYDSETKFSGSIGGGVRFPFNESVALQLGVRGYLTFLESDTDLFCVSGSEGAGCLVKSSGSTFFQTEAQLGLTVRF
jgi:opacity protein-like surface antigen